MSAVPTGLFDIMGRKQIRSIVDSTARINVWHGAVSSGKTIASLLALLFAIVQAPQNGLIFIVGRTQQTIERNIIDVLQQTYGPFGPIARYIQHTRGANTATILGRTVWLVGANDIRAEGRIRGSTAALIYIDEATLIPESFFTMCLSRLRVRGARLLATTNPDGPMHWLRQKFLLRSDLNMRQWSFNLDDNPALTEDYKNDLKAEYTGLFYRRFINGEWCLAEGSVFEAWEPDRHVVDELPPMLSWVGVGVDHGTVNPTAAELLGLGSDGRLYLASEYYYNSKVKLRQLSPFDLVAEIQDWINHVQIPGVQPPLYGVRPGYWVVDPSAAALRLELHRSGIASVHADNAVLPGIQLMSSLLATGRLRVHRSCTGFTNEIPGYSWDEKAAARGEDAPIKVDDHALDAARYVIRTTEAAWRTRLCQPNTDAYARSAAA